VDASDAARERVNNEVYHRLGARWYEADDDPIALLRAESRLRNPWVAGTIRARCGEGRRRVLDVGCGGGFLSNALAEAGHDVDGIDLAAESLEVARAHDRTRSVRYATGDAYALPFPDGAFDAACAMDFLEHVEEPGRVIAEAARVLRPGGLFFFHTFSRSFVSWLIVIKGVEWFVRNVPENLHVLRLFITPGELRAHCAAAGLEVEDVRGVRPVILSRAFWRMLATGRVGPDFRFTFARSPAIGYSGFARKVGGGLAR
jgi:2-polyprenyl-6-hydroxyphenyl methylase/3-demethylubiquinone-9 3-methyltransferase